MGQSLPTGIIIVYPMILSKPAMGGRSQKFNSGEFIHGEQNSNGNFSLLSFPSQFPMEAVNTGYLYLLPLVLLLGSLIRADTWAPSMRTPAGCLNRTSAECCLMMLSICLCLFFLLGILTPGEFHALPGTLSIDSSS